MSNRLRVLVVLALAVVLTASAGVYVLTARTTTLDERSSVASEPTANLDSVRSGPRIVFRNAAIGPELGRVALVPLADPGRPRAVTTLTCDRVFAAASKQLCLSSEPGVVTRYSAAVYDEMSGVRTEIPLSGSPSRARLSGDGSLAATTSFVAGDSYAATTFSTRTVITDLSKDASVDLENFSLVHEGRKITPIDRNYWGVTFAADDDRFFVTVAFGGQTHLAEGRLSTKTVSTLRTDAECPSLSPDETRVAYKKRGDRARGDWRLVVLDLSTGTETELAEPRSVDDQVEWLDDDQVVYGLPGEGTDAAQTNVWVTPADGTGKPAILIPRAWSPAVIR